jgi:outer membrane receptor protein involved in Fe transport
MSDTNADPAYVRDRTRVRGLVDLHAAWTSPGETWEIALWGRNVTNERYLLYSVDVSSLYRPATDPAPNSIRLATWNMPRLYGATVTWRWR